MQKETCCGKTYHKVLGASTSERNVCVCYLRLVLAQTTVAMKKGTSSKHNDNIIKATLLLLLLPLPTHRKFVRMAKWPKNLSFSARLQSKGKLKHNCDTLLYWKFVCVVCHCMQCKDLDAKFLNETLSEFGPVTGS